MLDCELYGLNPAGHHLTNLLFHIANSVLLFLFLNRLTRALWRSSFVATLFALHPLHVESVAWISERKDVLSTFFFLLTLMAYALYAGERDHGTTGPLDPGTANRRKGLKATAFYVLSLILFALGLMSKPMVVTLPFVLLLLDYWPLQRFPLTNFKLSSVFRFVLEKAPFFLLATVASVVTLMVQRAGGAVSSLDRIPLSTRAFNASVAYVQYLSNTFWPKDLAVLYPYQRHWPILSVVGSAVILTLITVLCAVFAKRRSYLLVGWFWFLGTLIPVIGLVQVGAQSMADRYMYIPSIGLFLILAWGAADLSVHFRCSRTLVGCLGVAATAACMACTGVQLRYWHDSVSLFRHAVDVTEANHIAWNSLGNAFNEAGQKENALACYTQSVRLNPDYVEGEYNLGTAYFDLGRLAEAISHLRSATQIDPTFARAFNNLARALVAAGQTEEGLRGFGRAVQLAPEWAEAHYNLGTCLLASSKPIEGVIELSKSVALDPANLRGQMNLGVALAQQGRTDEALPHFARAVMLAPDNPEAHFNYGLGLLDHGRPDDASLQFSEELRLSPNEAKGHYRMAVALVRLNKPEEAVLHYRETLRLAPDFSQAAQELASLQGSEVSPSSLPK